MSACAATGKNVGDRRRREGMGLFRWRCYRIRLYNGLGHSGAKYNRQIADPDGLEVTGGGFYRKLQRRYNTGRRYNNRSTDSNSWTY